MMGLIMRYPNWVTWGPVKKLSSWNFENAEINLSHLVSSLHAYMFRNMFRNSYIPSRELTYPLPRHFWRWFSSSIGGIDYIVSWRVMHSNCLCYSHPEMTLIWDLVWSPPDLYPTRHIFASHLKRFTLAKFGLETTPKPDPTHISRPFTVNFLKLENTCHKPPVKVIWPSTSNILPISTAKNMYVKHTCIKFVWSPFWNLQTFNSCQYIFFA